ncbi:MAG TPA: DUF1579 family protein [Pyrinomonadaceae bacterium]|nr:DUF1579 family protein [Pyrinomonadaceae bacterium]
MSVPTSLALLAGDWKGTNRLYLPPASTFDSDSRAHVSLRISGQFIGIAYTWEYEGNPHEGLLIVGCDNKSNAAQAVWTDSWHMSHKFMLCDGTTDSDGMIDVKGYYQVEGHPDWGWRTTIEPNGDAFKYTMYNVTPEGDEMLAVETNFTRA